MTGNLRQDNRNVALRGFDAGRAAMSGFLTFTNKAGAPLSYVSSLVSFGGIVADDVFIFV